MKKDTYKTPMLFRFTTTKSNYGEIFAIMPYEIADAKGNVTIFQHVGEHSAGDYDACMQMSRPATRAEYEDLITELESRGYDIQVVKARRYDRYLKAYKEIFKPMINQPKNLVVSK